MVRPIIKDVLLLQKKAVPAGRKDAGVGRDLLDTLKAHESTCAGMAANMIGKNLSIIAVRIGPAAVLMYNPVILKKSGKCYLAEEGCLSLSGTRPVRRYETVEVFFEDADFAERTMTFHGYPAEIIQHECDHLQGILI